MKKTISLFNRVLLIASGILLLISIFVPLWQIQLDAPQYPEGLTLKIFANKLGGDVEIINGLNHYIGMKTLHAQDFIEFQILIYIVLFFAVFAFITAFLKSKKLLYVLFCLFVFFGVIAMADFWRWEYAYGHDLNPNAAIIVPGMAYQPPLIGFKQLLNFGAYSIPDIGGWLFIITGILMLTAVMQELGIWNRIKKTENKKLAFPIFLVFLMNACQNNVPERILINKSSCDNCKMTITDLRFAGEIITEKGRIYTFDDTGCMLKYKNENKSKMNNAQYYSYEFISPKELFPSEKMFYVSDPKLGSPMGGNLAAFSNAKNASTYMNTLHAEMHSWTALNK